jgi:hypothetical protein
MPAAQAGIRQLRNHPTDIRHNPNKPCGYANGTPLSGRMVRDKPFTEETLEGAQSQFFPARTRPNQRLDGALSLYSIGEETEDHKC